MRPFSLRLRLTAWYFGILAPSLLAISVIAVYGMNRSINSAVDHALDERATAVRALMRRTLPTGSIQDLVDEIKEHSQLDATGDLMQVADARARWLYRSRLLADHDVPLPAATQPAVRTERFNGLTLRIRNERISIDGTEFSVQVATPLHEFREAIERFQWLLYVVVPALLLCATAGGYFMSRRALSPVEKVIDAAESIGAKNLSSRLVVPSTGDELQRLSETLNKMLTRIEGAFTTVSQFTADASHELRTPLAILRTRAELALRRARSADEYREVLEQLLNGLERTSDLVDRLMLLARSDSGAQSLHRSELDLNVILRRVCEQGVTLAAAKNLNFKAELEPHGILLEGDQDFLERLFLILIDNAIKYTPACGDVAISSRLVGSMATIAVRDSGIGIGASDLPNVFERFYRADKARSRESGGSGLGLAIGRWIAEAHDGAISVESMPGEGATFSVSLPVSRVTSSRFRHVAGRT
ncbi:MAG TPA: ATP-binding protein [Steroidobacteraceae bacterium]|jgi:heavy metal sensor kinase